jgi:glycosyltransferase involved in cell wall biosynthesis
VGDAPARVLFINSGILGHRTVGTLFRDVASLLPRIEAVHTDLSSELSLADRAARRLFSLRFAPARGAAANLDLRRWRQELNVGLLAARRIAHLERQRGPFQVLHFHTQASAYASLRRMRHTPSIVSIDCTQSLASLEAESAVSRGSYLPNVVHDGLVFRRARAITATSRWAADDLVKGYPDCAGKVHVMPYPILAHFPTSTVEDRFDRTRAEPCRSVQVLFVGGDFPRKGGPELLDAWRASGLAGRATLQVVTGWPIPPESLPDGVRLVRGVTPHSDVWRSLWQTSDLFVMPARHEAFGLVYQEAAAAGLPVVATRINAVPEIVEDGRTGILVPPGDSAALVRAMQALVESAELRRRMGAAALARIATATPAAYAARLQLLIAAALDTHHVYAA